MSFKPLGKRCTKRSGSRFMDKYNGFLENDRIRLKNRTTWAMIMHHTVPSDSISFKLEEFKQVLGFFPVTGFLLGRQSVIRNKQRMGTTTFVQRT